MGYLLLSVKESGEQDWKDRRRVSMSCLGREDRIPQGLKETVVCSLTEDRVSYELQE